MAENLRFGLRYWVHSRQGLLDLGEFTKRFSSVTYWGNLGIFWVLKYPGWWARGKTPLKNMSSSVGMMKAIPNISGKMPNWWQPVTTNQKFTMMTSLGYSQISWGWWINMIFREDISWFEHGQEHGMDEIDFIAVKPAGIPPRGDMYQPNMVPTIGLGSHMFSDKQPLFCCSSHWLGQQGLCYWNLQPRPRDMNGNYMRNSASKMWIAKQD